MPEITSPPYPSEGSTAESIYQRFIELRAWIHVTVIDTQDDVKTMMDQPTQVLFPDLREIPLKHIYLSLPVSIQFQHLCSLRRIRECWDHLIREYEEAWNCEKCLRLRACLLQASITLFNDAFVPYEVREMKAERQLEQMHQMMEAAWKGAMEALKPKHREVIDEEDKFKDGSEDDDDPHAG